MAIHSSVLAWRIPGMAEPGELASLGSHRVGHNWSDLAAPLHSRMLNEQSDMKPLENYNVSHRWSIYTNQLTQFFRNILHSNKHFNMMCIPGAPASKTVSVHCWKAEAGHSFLLLTKTGPVPGSVQFSSVAQSCLTLCDPMNRSTPGLPVHHKLMSMESVMPSSHLILCRPLLLLPPVPPSIRGFSNESTLRIRWPKYWSFSFSISSPNEHLGLISFRMDWLYLFAVQGTLKSLLQHHSSKASILQHSAFFTVQLYIHTWLLEKL